MIIARLHNGLGNQMFQYAAGLALARHHGTRLKLDISWFENPNREKHEVYGLSSFNIKEHFATKRESLAYFPKSHNWVKRWVSKTAKRFGIGSNEKTYYFQRQWGFDPQFLDLPADTYLDGYFQHPSYFGAIEDALRSHFTFKYPPTEEVARLSDQIRSASPSVFLHFRRQDYVQSNQVYGPLQMDYYLRSLRELKSRIGYFTAFIFSDDVESIERELKLDIPHHFIRTSNTSSAHDELRLMSLCDHAIISNSTFAWWGAWLNPSSRKIVVAPKPWHADIDPQFRELKPAPPSWIGIDRNPEKPLSNF